MKVESEHWALLAGLLFIVMGLLHFNFFVAGVVICILSYAIDLVKRAEEVFLEEE